MKFLVFNLYDMDRSADVAQASDKARQNAPPGLKTLGLYSCLAIPLPGLPENKGLSVSVIEADSGDTIGALIYPLALAGASVSCVPVMDVTPGAAAQAEREIRG